MAEKKKHDGLTAYMVVGMEFEPDGWLKKFFIDAKPEEMDAAQKLVPQLIQAVRNATGGASEPPTDSPRLFDEIDKYLDEQERSGNWRPQSVLDIRGDFQQFKQILGDVRVDELNHERLNHLRDTLLRLPANINKVAETRGKSVEEILPLGLPPQSGITVRKKWTRLISFCEWLVGKGLLAQNFAKGKKPKAKARSYEKFTIDDLRQLLESDEYRSGSFREPFQYWLPVLGLYTGARLEELAQLHLADVHGAPTDPGIHVFDITVEVDEEEGADTAKGLKNAHSTRMCPVHSVLVELGLLRYIDQLKQSGCDRLFPELKPDALGRVGSRASEWFTEYRRNKKVGATTGKSRKVFHSFRHTMNATLQKAGVEQEVREALCGHKHKDTNTRVYGGKIPLTILKNATGKLDYGIELTAFHATKNHESARLRGTKRL